MFLGWKSCGLVYTAWGDGFISVIIDAVDKLPGQKWQTMHGQQIQFKI